MQNLQNVICITDRHLCHRPFQDQMRIVAAMKPKAVILRWASNGCRSRFRS